VATYNINNQLKVLAVPYGDRPVLIPISYPTRQSYSFN
jgi:hypothetical protein